jgi:LysR family transcriptional regulator, glycine cleavage system transcriptional activator
LNLNRPVVGLPTLTWLRAFEAAARTSSFTAAAAELRLTSGAISYQIRALESHLGFPLFERLPRGVKLTPLGVAYLPPVRRAFEQLADSTVGIFGGSERREVGIHAPVSLASLWLAPKFPSFMAAHPGIDIRLSSVIWDNPEPDASTDLEIRYGSGQWRGYRADRLMSQRIVVVCSPAMLERARAEGEAGNWLPQHLIHIMGQEDHWLNVRQAMRLGAAAERRGLAVDTTVAALELAAHGAGYALAHRVFLEPYLAAGRLVYAFEHDFIDDSSYFLVAPERPQRVRREVQQFRDWLLTEAARAEGAETIRG